MTDPGSVEACGRRLAQDGVEIDVLVNNAGLYTTTSLLAIDEERLTEALEVNLIGAWRTCRQFVPAMRDRGWGAWSTCQPAMRTSPTLPRRPAPMAWPRRGSTCSRG